MSKFLAAFMAFICCAISIKAQNTSQFNLDDFGKYIGISEKVTTELIECSATSNIYKRIDIHRNYGVPRFGVITDCNQNIDTVWYIPSNYNRLTSGGINAPEITDTSITIWWNGVYFTLKIMDVSTGNVVLNETHSGQAASLFANIGNTLELSDAYGGPVANTITFDNFYAKEDNNPGTTITYSDLANGLYWIYIVDDNNVIWYMNTLRKGI